MRRRHKKRRQKAERKLAVTPSESIEQRVSMEIRRGCEILANLNSENFLGSPYLVSAIYYHDGLLDDFQDKPSADPAGRIVAQLSRTLNAGLKARFIALIEDRCANQCSELGAGAFTLPVPFEDPAHPHRATHPFAIDLFTPEGTPVRSATRGLVVLAEGGWASSEWFSTSSVRGGNTVIVFSADASCFFRYAHLDSVTAQTGLFVESGEVIGTVGHTGFNAERKGHGRHLHLEINEFDGRVVRALSHEELKFLLEAAREKARA